MTITVHARQVDRSGTLGADALGIDDQQIFRLDSSGIIFGGGQA